MKQLKKMSALLLAAMMILSLLTGCGSVGSGYKGDSAAPAPEAMEPGYDTMDENYGFDTDAEEEAAIEDMGIDEPMGEGDDGASGESVYDRTDVKLIRRASVNVETTDFENACAALLALTKKVGGYMEDSQIYQGSYGDTYRSADYVVRVPAKQYNAFLSGVDDSEAFHVTMKNESTEDVGNDYADTEARLKALRTKLDRLNTLMEQAENMEEIIVIQDAISDTEAQIDRRSATLTRYDRLISYATICVSIQQVRNFTDTVEDPFFSRVGSSFVTGAKEFGRFLQDVVIWVAGNIFGLLLFLLLAVLVFRILRRATGNKPAKLGRREKKSNPTKNEQEK